MNVVRFAGGVRGIRRVSEPGPGICGWPNCAAMTPIVVLIEILERKMRAEIAIAAVETA